MDAECVEILELDKNYSSLTAKHDISKGSFLGDFWGKVGPELTMHSLQIGSDKHIECPGKTRFTNHSCSPNAQFVYSQHDGSNRQDLKKDEEVSWHLVASRDIVKGEPISFDYTLTEYSMIDSFECLCKSKNCLGKVQGFKYLSLEDKKKRLTNASPVIIELFEKENN